MRFAILDLQFRLNFRDLDSVRLAFLYSADCSKHLFCTFFSLLNCKDTQVIQVVLDGLNNMLKLAGPDVSNVLTFKR